MLRSLRWSILLLLIPASADGDPPTPGKAAPLLSADDDWISWKRRVLGLARIKAAPQFGYKVEKLTVYQNGVWADYAFTNRSNRTLYFPTLWLGRPVTGLAARDAADVKWRVPRFGGSVSYADPDTFVAIHPGGTVRFRQNVNDVLEKPLEPVDPPAGGKGTTRPTELSYVIAQWVKADTNLGTDHPESVYGFATGSGKVPVTWVDEAAPKTLHYQVRLYGNE